MKRYLQAGTVVFFFFIGIILIGRLNTAKPRAQTQIPTHDLTAAFDASVLYAKENRNEQNNGDEAPALTVNAALMKSALNNRIFYELNADQYWPLASLTKLMTAVIALENIPQTKTRDTLLQRMMVLSDNDAADALAETLGTEQYLALMNAKAQTLGMRQTGFSDANGLSYLNQSTVRDIDKLVTYIMIRHPKIFAVSRLKKISVDGKERANINEFANRADFMGGKTGFTDEANGNLVTIFSTASGPVTIITLGAPTKEDRFTETVLLFSWATQHFKL